MIFAAVSTPEQAESERASIPSQIEAARNLIRRREWQEVADPLVVPGQSRSIDFLHEAVLEIKPISELVDLAKRSEIDLVVVKDYDRLSRTRSLLTQLSTYLSHCGVQIYATEKPVEPVPASDVRRRRAVYSSATVEAFAGLEAEREVARLVERRYFGMSALMKKGHWRNSKLAYGYTRENPGGNGGGLLPVPIIVPSEAAIIRRIEAMYLEDGMGSAQTARAMNTLKIPAPKGAEWGQSSILDILSNPFYCGWIVWGIRRAQKVYDPELEDFVRRSVWIDAYRALWRMLDHRPGLRDIIEHKAELEAEGAVIVEGAHEPIRSVETQYLLDAEQRIRYVAKGRAASSTNQHIFVGLTTCDDCGAAFTTKVHHGVVYYLCSGRKNGRTQCQNGQWIREEAIYEAVMGVLQEFSNNPGAVDAYLERLNDVGRKDLEDETEALRSTIENLSGKRTRWDDAYESGIIDLDTYSARLKALTEEREALELRLRTVTNSLTRDKRREEQRKTLLQGIEHIPPLTHKRELKLAMRRVLSNVRIKDRQVCAITFREL